MGAKLSSNFALEAGFADLGEVRMAGVDSVFGNSSTTTEASALFAAARGIIPIGPDFSLFGKLGRTSGWPTGPGDIVSTDEGDFDLMSIGVILNF